MKKFFKTTMAMYLVLAAMSVANTSMAQGVALNPQSISMSPGESRFVEIISFGGEIIDATTTRDWGVVEVTRSSPQTYSSRGPALKWIFRVMGKIRGTVTVTFTVTIRDGRGTITTITVTLSVTVELAPETPESLSSPESSVSMDAIKQD